MSRIAAWVRIALIDMRGDFRRFGILLACLALGVATIAIVGSVGAALQAALDRDARVVLNGDLEAYLSYRAANADERALFAELGPMAEVIEVLGRGTAGTGSAFLAVRAVGSTYPLLGSVTIDHAADSAATLPELLAKTDGVFGTIVDSLLLDRLGIAVGDSLTIGEGTFQIRGVLAGLPDQVTQGVQLGIPALVSLEGLTTTNILAPGVIARYRYKILLENTDFDTAATRIRAQFPDAGWTINSPANATEDIARFFDIFTRFLVIVGLSSLLVGGVGVSNAVSAYITDRQRSIATLRSLGATNAQILVHFFTQVGLLAAIGIGFGLLLGVAFCFIALPIIGNILSINLPLVLDAGTLLTAAAFGALVAFAFAYLPLRRAQKLKPAILFRSAGSAVSGGLGWRDYLDWRLWVPLLVAGGLIFGLAVLSTGRVTLVTWYAAGAIAAFIVLRIAAAAVQRLIALLPPLPNAGLRNALKNIHRPGSAAPTVILSLGLGLALLLLIALIDNSLRRQLDSEVLVDAPSFIFMDLFPDEADTLQAFAGTDNRVESFSSIPMLRGRLAAVNGQPLGDAPGASAEVGEMLHNEIPLTWSAEMPAQSTITSGEWWPADYSGEPLISVFSQAQRPLGLKLGDTVEIAIFGETLKAKIANFRDFAWRSGSINFSFVLSPGSFDDFPSTAIGLLKTEPGLERTMQPVLISTFPDLNFLPVGDALDAINGIISSLINAIAVVGALALVSGLLVLAGAMAAGRRQREADSVVMKVLGATRRDVVLGYLFEYGLLGVLAALLATALGIVGAWGFVTNLLEIDLYVDPWLILGVLAGAVGLAILIGMVVTWTALSSRPAGYLRGAE